MKDTSAQIEQKFRQMLAQCSGEERLNMGCSMHATAQALVKASILRQHPEAHPAEIKRLLFLRFYATDFDSEERQRITLTIARSGRTAGGTRKARRGLAKKRRRHSKG